MGHDHEHSRDVNRRRLAVALAIVVAVLVVEVVGGVLSGSLALLADAGHMASDAIGLAVALTATVFAARPPTDRHTYGFRRLEVLGALVNGLILTVLAVVIAIEGVRRLSSPETVDVLGGPMLAVAAVGLVANIVVLRILSPGRRDSINMRGAYLEVLGDLFGSIAAVGGALAVVLFGFALADPIASLVIAALILPRAVLLLRDVVRVLTESAPRETDAADIRRHILSTHGVVDVHDVHVWAITTGSSVFSAHVVVEARLLERGGSADVLSRLSECLSEHFDVAHSTFQLEPAGEFRHDHSEHHR